LTEADEQQFLSFCITRPSFLYDEVVALAFSENAPPSFWFGWLYTQKYNKQNSLKSSYSGVASSYKAEPAVDTIAKPGSVESCCLSFTTADSFVSTKLEISV
jgi:hypothetical protein